MRLLRLAGTPPLVTPVESAGNRGKLGVQSWLLGEIHRHSRRFEFVAARDQRPQYSQPHHQTKRGQQERGKVKTSGSAEPQNRQSNTRQCYGQHEQVRQDDA